MNRSWLLLLLGLAAAGSPRAATADPQWAFHHWRTGLALPVSLRFAPDGRLFYIEVYSGRIRVFADTSAATATTWATVPITTANHRGLMGIGIHPAFPDSPYVYVYHTNPSPIVNRVVRLTDQGGVGVDYTVIVDNIPAGLKNNGGKIVFGPDGMMYLTLGDNEVPSSSPDAGDIRGKILRYTPMGEPAPGNPFGAGNPAYAKGVRNSYGLSFDPVTGHAYFTENGAECDDEVNWLVAGADYGWGPGYVCGTPPGGTMTPVVNYSVPIAPTGCVIYRGARYPDLDGSLLFGGYADDSLRRVVLDPMNPGASLGATVIATEPLHAQIMDVIVGPDEEIWACGPGSIMRLYRIGGVGVGDPPVDRAFRLTPNPFRASLAMRFPDGLKLDRLEILDPGGRRVRQWDGPLAGTLVWDGRDAGRRPVPAGLYLVRGTAAGRPFASRVVRLPP